jgi:hypothetical protein
MCCQGAKVQRKDSVSTRLKSRSLGHTTLLAKMWRVNAATALQESQSSFVETGSGTVPSKEHLFLRVVFGRPQRHEAAEVRRCSCFLPKPPRYPRSPIPTLLTCAGYPKSRLCGSCSFFPKVEARRLCCPITTASVRATFQGRTRAAVAHTAEDHHARHKASRSQSEPLRCRGASCCGYSNVRLGRTIGPAAELSKPGPHSCRRAPWRAYPLYASWAADCSCVLGDSSLE